MSRPRPNRERLSTLYLDSNGVGLHAVVADTVLRGMLGYRDGDRPPQWLGRNRHIAALFGHLRDVNAALSYGADWREAFLAAPELEVEICNINNLVHFGRCLARLRHYDLIVVSHVAAGDDMRLLSRAAACFDRRRGPLVVFIGNEYDLLDEKIGFVRRTEAEFVCSQLPLAAARYLYGGCSGTRIVEMPHALNPKHYFVLPDNPRPVDIGFVGDIYWPFVGDRERTAMIEWFELNGAARGLDCDIRKARLPRAEWNCFLNGCKGLIGAESGTYWLNERGRLLDRARAYNLRDNPAASFDDVFDRFYRGVTPEASGKCISSRHFEPIGTKTCQILLEGQYNGILEPDRHYIAVKKDFSNIEDALARFRDKGYRTRMVEETYEYALAAHTYRHRVAHLLDSVGAVTAA